MDNVLGLLVVVGIFILNAISKSNKNKQKKAADKPKPKSVLQSALAQTAPVQPPEPVVLPLETLTPTTNHRQSFENVISAFSELLDDDLPDPDQPVAAPVKVREQTAIEAETAMKQHTELIQARIQESLSGESYVDDHGCIGGSMPEHFAEGETLAEHAMHEKNRAARLQAEAVRAEDLCKPTAADLRKAIVMSEILDKPVSMRRRRI